VFFVLIRKRIACVGVSETKALRHTYTYIYTYNPNQTRPHLRIRGPRVVREVEGAHEHTEEVDGEGHGGVEDGADLVHDALALGGEEDLGSLCVWWGKGGWLDGMWC
jgi:hypothetical protein